MKPRSDIVDPNDCGCVNECDFIEDPDQMTDSLPQPFRMLNKVTERIIENAWMVISTREEERMVEAMRFKPPQYECGVQLQELDSTSCMCDSEDGKYVFVGLPDGIAAIDTAQQLSCDHWQDEAICVVSLSSVNLDQKVYMITTLDNMGVVRLFAFCKEMFFLLCTLYEVSPEVEQKVCAKKCGSSSFGDFTAIALEDVSSHETWLEVYKLPHDTWIKELEPLTAITRKDTLQISMASLDTNDSYPVAAVGSGHMFPERTRLDSPEELTNTKSLRLGQHQSQEERSMAKFTSPTLQLKAKPPPNKTTGMTSTTPFSACKAIDSTCDVVGSMSNHLLSTQLLETRQRLFEFLHPQIDGDEPVEVVQAAIEPTFHFVTAGRIYPSIFESAPTQGESSVLLVWWSNQHLLQHYSLRKPAKDVKESKEPKEQKCDVVWPLSDVIVTSAVSSCTTYIAVALKNNTIIVWDKLQGVSCHISRLQTDGAVSHLLFLPSDNNKIVLLAACSDGQMYTVDVQRAQNGRATKVTDVANSLEATPSSVLAVRNIPELIITCHKNGRLYVEDVLKQTPVCELTLPPTHSIEKPLHPVMCTTANGQIVYVKGESADGAAIFAFALRSFPTLDEYFSRKRPTTPVKLPKTVHEIAAAYFTERISEQATRVTSLQDRWRELKKMCEEDTKSRMLTLSA